jgi:FkbM family methyltransferase
MGWKEQAIVYLSGSSIHRKAYGMLKRMPLFGPILRRIGKFIVPSDSRVWLQVPTGLGRGLWLHLNPRFEMDYAHGVYEPLIERVITSSLGPGSVFYDVGAHIGVYSLLAARIVGESGAVFAFEPDVDNAERIREHALRNGFNQIRVVPYAVWSTAARLRFQRAQIDSSRNQGAVITGPGLSNANTTEVDAVTLDTFSQDHLAPTLIKMDIEGGEAAALKGSDGVFAIHRPVLICEVHNQAAEEQVTKWLYSKGYNFSFVEETHSFPRHLLGRESDKTRRS